MIKKIDKNLLRRKRSRRIRKKISGSASRPRLSIYKGKNIYAQIIDDTSGTTLVSSSSIAKHFKDKNLKANKDSAKIIGNDIALKALDKGIKKVVFDRNGYSYTGVVVEFANSARESGLEF